MRRTIIGWIAAAGLTLLAQPVEAGWWDHWDRAKLDFHRMNCYPEPFVQADRRATQAPFNVMTNKGWQLQNTLGNQHFNPETQQLTRSGELKVMNILNQGAMERRVVFVLRGANDEATSVRLDSVQQTAARIVPRGDLPEVIRTSTEPRGWPADYIYEIDTKTRSSIPSPRLPAMQDTSGS